MSKEKNTYGNRTSPSKMFPVEAKRDFRSSEQHHFLLENKYKEIFRAAQTLGNVNYANNWKSMLILALVINSVFIDTANVVGVFNGREESKTPSKEKKKQTYSDNDPSTYGAELSELDQANSSSEVGESEFDYSSYRSSLSSLIEQIFALIPDDPLRFPEAEGALSKSSKKNDPKESTVKSKGKTEDQDKKRFLDIVEGSMDEKIAPEHKKVLLEIFAKIPKEDRSLIEKCIILNQQNDPDTKIFFASDSAITAGKNFADGVYLPSVKVASFRAEKNDVTYLIKTNVPGRLTMNIMYLLSKKDRPVILSNAVLILIHESLHCVDQEGYQNQLHFQDLSRVISEREAVGPKLLSEYNKIEGQDKFLSQYKSFCSLVDSKIKNSANEVDYFKNIGFEILKNFEDCKGLFAGMLLPHVNPEIGKKYLQFEELAKQLKQLKDDKSIDDFKKSKSAVIFDLGKNFVSINIVDTIREINSTPEYSKMSEIPAHFFMIPRPVLKAIDERMAKAAQQIKDIFVARADEKIEAGSSDDLQVTTRNAKGKGMTEHKGITVEEYKQLGAEAIYNKLKNGGGRTEL